MQVSPVFISLGVTGLNLGLALWAGFQHYNPAEDDFGYQTVGILLMGTIGIPGTFVALLLSYLLVHKLRLPRIPYFFVTLFLTSFFNWVLVVLYGFLWDR